MNTAERQWLNKAEAAEFLGLSKSTIARAKQAGKLPAKKTAGRGGRELYRVEDLLAWVDSMEDA